MVEKKKYFLVRLEVAQSQELFCELIGRKSCLLTRLTPVEVE